MQNNFEKVLEEHPGSELHKYGDWFELKLRIEKGPGCFKISGERNQVKAAVDFIILRFGQGKEK